MGILTSNLRPSHEPPKGLGERLAALLRGPKRSAARVLRHVETLPLGSRRSLYLVECDGERFLVAADGEGLSAPVPLTQRFTMQPASGGEQR